MSEHCLDPNFSTTRFVTRSKPEPRAASDSLLHPIRALPEHPGRKGEGGLRTRGYFKAVPDSDGDSPGITSRPVVTVVTVVYNGSAYLEQTILSVLNQTYDRVEYIVIDAGSTDGTLGIIRKYDHAIDYWVSEPDGGIYDAWNKGVRLSGGEWIAFLGADDVYVAGAISAYVECIVQSGDRALEYVSSKYVLTDGARPLRTVGNRWNWGVFRRFMNVAHVGSLHHRRLFEKYGLYDISYRICGDYELLLRPRSKLRAEFLKGITANVRIGGVSDSDLLAFRETARAKSTAGNRNPLLCQMDLLLALGKWKVRRWIWY